MKKKGLLIKTKRQILTGYGIGDIGVELAEEIVREGGKKEEKGGGESV